MTTRQTVLVLFCTLGLLAGCGSGGSDEPRDQVPPPEEHPENPPEDENPPEETPEEPPEALPPSPPPKQFLTLPPATALPDGGICVKAVGMQQYDHEHRPNNSLYNQQTGHRLPAEFFATPYANDPRANTELASRVDGNFTGSTDEILRWGACKWGLDEDLVRAMAVKESWWRQHLRNNWGRDCPPRHPPGQDDPRYPDQCLRDYGIFQVNYRYYAKAWPGIEDSTAMNVDTALAVIRACYEGYELWLHDVAPAHQPYRAGDLDGCVGRYHSGRWHNAAAREYVSSVKAYLDERRWEQPYFDD